MELMAGRTVGGAVDLSNVVVGVPGRRAGRRLLEILVAHTEEKSLALIPPQLKTAAQLPELLYNARKPFADELTQRLAWIEALRNTERSQLQQVVRDPPSDGDLFAWLALGEMLSRLHREITADNLDFDKVLSRAGKIPGFNEVDRWRALAEIRQAYLDILEELDLWDLQTARLYAIEHQECETDKQIVLVGTVDLNRAQRAMLDQVADSVTALVFAPEEYSDRFDEHGCLIPAAWQNAAIDLDRSQIEVVDGAGDQADALIHAIAGFDAAYSAEEITIGVPDERLVPLIRQRLDECGIPARYGVGTPVSRTGPCRLLKVVAEYLESRRPEAFAAFVRHPAIQHWLAGRGIAGDWITQLDRYRREHLPTRIDGKWLAQRPDDFGLLRKVCEELDGRGGLLRELAGAGRKRGSKTAPDDWAAAIVSLLTAVYGQSALDRERDEDRITIAACDKIGDVLSGLQDIPAELAPNVSGAQALQIVLQSLSGERIPPRPDHSAVELLGWLELPLDDAPALVVTGFNEGLVPASRNSDLFLPNELRRQLGLEDNDRIYARDVYALSLLAASRKSLKLIAGRRTAEGDPLAPSRLLFACEPEEVARRTLEFLQDSGDLKKSPESPPESRPGTLTAGREEPTFAPPPPLQPLPEVDSMRVTEFRDYLACPYRYYLRHRLGLGAMDDTADELEADKFGSLLHDVLKLFGESEVSASDVAGEIADELSRLLDAETRRQFGRQPRSSVAVQIEQIRRRLEAFARWQADWVQAGWTIQVTERNIAEGTAEFIVDEKPIYLRGRIDRIDRHRGTGEIVVFDYKTGEKGKKPEATHRRRDEWVDLQLPLYRHLLPYIDELEPDSVSPVGDASVRLGYIVIPKATGEMGHHLAEWTPADLEHADETARTVVRDIRAGRFALRRGSEQAYFEEFAAICLEGQFATPPRDDDTEGE